MKFELKTLNYIWKVKKATQRDMANYPKKGKNQTNDVTNLHLITW